MSAAVAPPRPSLPAHVRLAARSGDMAGTLEHLHGRYGPVVDFGFKMPLRAVFSFGPEATGAGDASHGGGTTCPSIILRRADTGTQRPCR